PEPTPEPTVTPGPTARASQALTREPNACFGLGAGGSDAAEEPTSALTLQVPARHPVLIQVGRRGAPSSPDDDRAILSLDQEPVVDLGRPPGDRADQAPLASVKRTSYVELAGATITEEDPAQPPCPSLGTVWRRINPGSSGRRLISAGGVGTLTVFAGRRPTGDNVLDCVNRERSGALQMVVPVKRRRPLWIRLGTDRPVDGAEASLRISAGRGVSVIDGGPGGSDPTPGGPGGGFPFACDRARPERARVSGPALRGRAGARNAYRRVPVAVRVSGSSICDVELRLVGPRGKLMAKGRAVRLAGRRTVALPRLATFRKGRYRLKVTAVSQTGDRIAIRSSVGGRLR
ncbi:MAG TPA: hypothetical protein VM266_10360, partial [Solirubrobacteraceae bacterium]|nr:hypothetical protein [Solirubrobacteraceae bacterium]